MQTVRVPMQELAALLELQMDSGAEAQLTVVGTSMQPLFKDGRDSVYLQRPKNAPKKGDILFYRRKDGRYVLHRIVAEKQGAYLCCGDNQYRKECVLPGQIIAVVTGFVRSGREYTLREAGYRLYTAFWIATRPLRRPLFALRRALSKLKKTVLCQ